MYKKYLVSSALVIAIIFSAPKNGSAQFVNGSFYLGPHLAIGYFGTAASLGINGEVPVTQPGSAGPGRIAIAGRFDFSSNSFANVIVLAAMANYHYSLGEGDKVDLFGGLGIAFYSFSSAYYGASAPFLAIDAGVRYFTSSAFALRAMLGLINYPYLTLGVDWGL